MKQFKTIRAMKTQKLVEMMKTQGFVAWNIHITRPKLIVLLIMACNRINARNPYFSYMMLHNEYVSFLRGRKRRGTYNKYLCARELEAIYHAEVCPECKKKIEIISKKMAVGFSQREADEELEIILQKTKEDIENNTQRKHKRKIERDKLRLNNN